MSKEKFFRQLASFGIVCETNDWAGALQVLNKIKDQYLVYCFKCGQNIKCESLGRPTKCPICNGDIRHSETSLYFI